MPRRFTTDELSVILSKKYVLKDYIESDYQDVVGKIVDYEYMMDVSKTFSKLHVFIMYENGGKEWRLFSDLKEYIEPETREDLISDKFKSLDRDTLYELKLCMLAGIVIGGNIPLEYLSSGKELEDLQTKVTEIKNKIK